MSNMDRIVHAESNGKNNTDATGNVDSNVPKMKKANNIHKTHGDHQDHHDTYLNVAEEDKCDHNYS